MRIVFKPPSNNTRSTPIRRMYPLCWVQPCTLGMTPSRGLLDCIAKHSCASYLTSHMPPPRHPRALSRAPTPSTFDIRVHIVHYSGNARAASPILSASLSDPRHELGKSAWTTRRRWIAANEMPSQKCSETREKGIRSHPIRLERAAPGGSEASDRTHLSKTGLLQSWNARDLVSGLYLLDR